MLTGKAVILERELDINDTAVIEVTLRNISSCNTAKDVEIAAKLKGGPFPGVSFLPDDRSFGVIRPGKSVTKEFVITTDRADVRKYEVILLLEYESTHQMHECDSVCFEVKPD